MCFCIYTLSIDIIFIYLNMWHDDEDVDKDDGQFDPCQGSINIGGWEGCISVHFPGDTNSQ